nr:protein m25.1 [Murid betaherpesvirus 2]
MMRFDLEAQDLAYVCLSPDKLRDFLRVHRGRGFVLPWPRTHGVRIQTDADLGMPVGELNRLSRDYLCCPEELTVVGGVYRVGGTEDFVAAAADRQNGRGPRDGGGDEHLAVLLLGERTRVYLFVGGADNAVYLLAHSYAAFLKRGLRHYFPIYGETGCGDYGTGFLDRIVPGSVDSVARFAVASPGTMFALPWPKGAFIKIVSPRERVIAGVDSSWRLLYFASVVGPNLDPALREILLAVGALGVVYAYNPWEDSVVRVCGSVAELFAVGLRAVKKCYRFRHRLPFWFGDRIPLCPHVETFVPLPKGCFSSGSAVRSLSRIFELYGAGDSPPGRNGAAAFGNLF